MIKHAVSVFFGATFLCFICASSSFAFYKCYKIESGEILYTNVACPSGYNGYSKKSNSSTSKNQFIEMDESSAVELISQQNQFFKTAWMMSSVNYDERKKLVDLAKNKYGILIKK